MVLWPFWPLLFGLHLALACLFWGWDCLDFGQFDLWNFGLWLFGLWSFGPGPCFVPSGFGLEPFGLWRIRPGTIGPQTCWPHTFCPGTHIVPSLFGQCLTLACQNLASREHLTHLTLAHVSFWLVLYRPTSVWPVTFRPISVWPVWLWPKSVWPDSFWPMALLGAFNGQVSSRNHTFDHFVARTTF